MPKEKKQKQRLTLTPREPPRPQEKNINPALLLPLTQPTQPTQPNPTNDAWRPQFQSGISAFKAAKYRKAEARFTKALYINPNDLNILDCRAATYEKLDCLKDAMADGRSIISLSPTSAKGYLRVGKVLRLMDKHDKALQIYAIAKTKVLTTDRNHVQLVECADETERYVSAQLAKSKAHDIVQALPPELVLDIFARFPFPHLARYTGVSRTWRQFLLSAPILWCNLHFAPPRDPTTVNCPLLELSDSAVNRKLTNATVELWLTRAGGPQVREIVLGQAPRLTDTVFKTIIRLGCRALEKLEVMKCEESSSDVFANMLNTVGGNLRTLVLSSRVVDKVVRAALHSARGLRSLDLTGCILLTANAFLTPSFIIPHQSLNNLNLTGCVSIDDDAVARIAVQFPNLKHLFLAGCERITNLGLTNLLPLLPTLHSLHLSGTCLSSSPPPPLESVLIALTSHPTGPFANLRSFSLTSCPALTDHGLSAVLSACHVTIEHLDVGMNAHVSDASLIALSNLKPPCLQSLQIGSCPDVTDEGVKAVAKGCVALQKLNLSRLAEVTDAALMVVGERLSELSELDLSACRRVTGSGVRWVVQGRACLEKKLMRLRLDSCEGVWTDAVELAKRRMGKNGIVTAPLWVDRKRIG